MKIEKAFLGVSVSREVTKKIERVTSQQKEVGEKTSKSRVAEAALSLGLQTLEKMSQEELNHFFAAGDNHPKADI
ncbi:hypothetical protein DB346_05350 [Verrucomicrobia bacterium LW23]|nr:hypothetical protein DB346_05350 [Verrucomicrobia bacterium LW23]